jgi:SAM-dependent methyltransferase
VPLRSRGMDWGVGHYERVAVGLWDAAYAVVEHAAPTHGERVADIGCGTGNAARLAAERGARVTGVDPAARLLDVARADAASEGLEIRFVQGATSDLPLAGESADVVLSVFGVIFAPDAWAAAAEIARVSAPAGRVVLSAWIPGGALSDAMKARRDALAAAGVETLRGRPFAWHEYQALSGLLGPYGFAVELLEHKLAFHAASAREFAEFEFRDHPMWIGAREVLEDGEWRALRDRVLEIFQGANETSNAFCVLSRYAVAIARRT